MGAGVLRVVKLAGDDRAGQLARKLPRLLNRARHALFALGQNDLGAVGGQKRDALAAHGVRHGENHAVAARRADGGKADAGVAAGRLDDHAAGSKRARALRGLDHEKRRTVFRAAGGIHEFQLAEKPIRRAQRTRGAGQAHERRVTDEGFDAVIQHVKRLP